MIRASVCARFDELKAADRLPTPPGVTLALLRLTGSEGSSVQEIAAVLEADPALLGRAIKLANSAALRGGRPVVAAREAVVRLGMHTIANLALGCWLVTQSGGPVCQAFDYTEYWHHCLAVASAAKAIATQLKTFSPDEAFTCGMLSQVGRLALASVYPEPYAEILGRCRRNGMELLPNLEREQFATDNTEVTVALLQDWGLPSDYVDAVFLQSLGMENIPEGSRAEALARILDLALLLARTWLASEQARERLLAECLERATALAIEAEPFLALSERALKEWHSWSQTLKVSAPEIASLRERSSEHNFAARGLPVAGPENAEGRNLRLLVVSQEPLLIDHLQGSLAQGGHVLSWAGKHEEAWERIIQEAPHVVILDGIGSAEAGNQLYRQILEARFRRYLYILGLTEPGDEGGNPSALQAEADDFLAKPVDPLLLAARLRAATRIIGLQEAVQHEKEQLQRFALELAVANRRLQQAANEDVLTQLANRRCGMEWLNQEWDRAVKSGQSIACVLADIDHFKRVNDTHGHDVGDQVLQGTAEVMRRTVRASDLACRLGGEEFLILCPQADLTSARKCAERLCTQVRARRYQVGSFQGNITLSAGIAVREPGMAAASDLLKAADNAVYQAKRTGRDRICP